MGTSLQPEEREKILATLKRNIDLFVWRPSDMPGIDETIITHKLSISPETKPVSQKKRKVGEERRAAIIEEVSKLKEAGFIEEIKYPSWLANVVMGKKASGKWRMCVDFTDLNKACPKDPYPLPNIDRLKRVLIDSGSSADIMYWEAFKAMQLSNEHLLPYNDTLVGFIGRSHGLHHIAYNFWRQGPSQDH
ncbi:hypothetical protein QL285_009574 [Trifolium repens]|nr:hypothetical protein QL285_009574 [Trifolium repens]